MGCLIEILVPQKSRTFKGQRYKTSDPFVVPILPLFIRITLDMVIKASHSVPSKVNAHSILPRVQFDQISGILLYRECSCYQAWNSEGGGRFRDAPSQRRKVKAAVTATFVGDFANFRQAARVRTGFTIKYPCKSFHSSLTMTIPKYTTLISGSNAAKRSIKGGRQVEPLEPPYFPISTYGYATSSTRVYIKRLRQCDFTDDNRNLLISDLATYPRRSPSRDYCRSPHPEAEAL